MRISRIEIKRFRSINNLTLTISESSNLITICGQNNVGKTNILRALNLFFNKKEFDFKKDIPEFKQMTGGASVFPLIKITFTVNNNLWEISKNFDPKKITDTTENNYHLIGKKNTINIDEKETLKFLSSINFFYLPSINISFPEIINFLVDDQFLDIEFGKSRMKGKKGVVKSSLEKAKNTLQEILDDLTASIDPSFKEFHNSWGIKFDVPKNINRFREIINNEIDFIITDDTQTEIHSKGAGLQRLGHILMVIRIVEKLISNRKKCIILIDEPDIYLHYKLQKKLFEKIKNLSQTTQVFITTHSPIFINPYKLDNLFLLELLTTETFSNRKSKTGNILATSLVDLRKNDSVFTVKEILGIEDRDSYIIGKNNLLVEGSEDKKYLEELINVFDLSTPNIISANGVTNFIKLLDYYDTISESNDEQITFKVLFDNDEAGREQYKKIKKKVDKGAYQNITIKCIYIIDAYHTTFPKDKPNIEIEDFIYPEIILELSNLVFKKKSGFKKILDNSFFKKVNNPSLRYNGVLEIIDNLKNERNPENGMIFSTKESGFKGGLANSFNLKGNNIEIQKVLSLDSKYPKVKEFLIELTND
jgi:predicted ATP-dependent endonuclease of OLD family